MSAYIVDRNHILYLLAAATSPVISPHGDFRWFHSGEWHALATKNRAQAADVGNMLWRENIASVSARYPNESSATLPGPCNEHFVIKASDIRGPFAVIAPVQVLKSCDCYNYQSCEHDGWKKSEARAFIENLRAAAIDVLPGYNEAVWGAPEKEAE